MSTEKPSGPTPRAAPFHRRPAAQDVKEELDFHVEMRARERDRREWLGELRQDVAYAVRQLVRTPAFTAIAVLTLALGIGATTAIFSAVRSVVLRPFPFAHPERVMFVTERWQGNDGAVSDGNFVDWYARQTSFEKLAAEQFAGFTVADRNSSDR